MYNNKIAGCLYGHAIGNALGIGTEFMTRPEVEVRYPDGLTRYDQIIRDAHRNQWQSGEFSIDTEFILLTAESLIEAGYPDYKDLASRLKKWYNHKDYHDIDSSIRWVLSNPRYESDPHGVSHEVYQKQRHFEAHNEALGRAIIVGLYPGLIESNVIANCRLTHWDSRCIVSCVILALMAHNLFWHSQEADYKKLTEVCRRLDPRALPYLVQAHDSESLDVFDLDDEETLWYTRKAMGAALWCIWHHDDPGEALYEVVTHGGDADTNGALAMSLMGLKYGFKSFPPHLVEGLINKERLNFVAHSLANVIIKAGANAGIVQQ